MNNLTTEFVNNLALSQNIENPNQSNADNSIVQNILSNDVALIGGNNSTSIEDEMNNSLNEHLLEEFKKNVKNWLKLDNDIKRVQLALKGLKEKKNSINEEILNFMKKFNIEDLNTKDGVIRYKTTYIKEPLSQKTIKNKLQEMFENQPEIYEKIEGIFTNRGKIEKNSLRRVNL
jgi:seryl-tRNA synthetase